MEGGRAQPSVQVLAAIADYYGVSTDYLLGRSDIRAMLQQADLVESQYEWASEARLGQLPEEDRGFLKDMYLNLLRRRGIDPAPPPRSPAPTPPSPRKRKNDPAA